MTILTAKLQFIFALAFFMLSHASYGQTNASSKIVGTWNLKNVKFLKKPGEKDSLRLMEEVKGLTITFEKGNKFVTKRKSGNEVEIVESGNYAISADGKKIEQNGEEADILILNDEKLVIAISEEVTFYFTRIGN